jgi:hypothetical protein
LAVETTGIAPGGFLEYNAAMSYAILLEAPLVVVADGFVQGLAGVVLC